MAERQLRNADKMGWCSTSAQFGCCHGGAQRPPPVAHPVPLLPWCADRRGARAYCSGVRFFGGVPLLWQLLPSCLRSALLPWTNSASNNVGFAFQDAPSEDQMMRCGSSNGASFALFATWAVGAPHRRTGSRKRRVHAKRPWAAPVLQAQFSGAPKFSTGRGTDPWKTRNTPPKVSLPRMSLNNPIEFRGVWFNHNAFSRFAKDFLRWLDKRSSNAGNLSSAIQFSLFWFA